MQPLRGLVDGIYLIMAVDQLRTECRWLSVSDVRMSQVVGE